MTVRTAATVASRHDPPPLSDRQARAAVALFLYGRDDPDDIVAAGAHGLGGAPTPVRIARLGRCWFALTTAAGSEIVDFDRIAAARYVMIDDPAAGIAQPVAPGGRGQVMPQLPLIILDGAPDAICRPQGCTGHRVLALAAVGRLAAAQAAATTFRAGVCPELRPDISAGTSPAVIR